MLGNQRYNLWPYEPCFSRVKQLFASSNKTWIERSAFLRAAPWPRSIWTSPKKGTTKVKNIKEKTNKHESILHRLAVEGRVIHFEEKQETTTMNCLIHEMRQYALEEQKRHTMNSRRLRDTGGEAP